MGADQIVVPSKSVLGGVIEMLYESCFTFIADPKPMLKTGPRDLLKSQLAAKHLSYCPADVLGLFLLCLCFERFFDGKTFRDASVPVV